MHVLVVDDDDRLLRATALHLSADADVTMASSVDAAVYLLGKQRVDDGH